MDQKIGKYRIIERIGRGGMGSVYKAHDPVLDRLVALKVVSAETDHTDELRARFFREAQACAKLSHPNIVTIHDLGEADGNLFIVMELLEGEELRQLIAKKTLASIEDKFPLMVQICDGLEFAHEKGIVHRDVKPANIFVLRNGQVKILDFGIAHIAAAQTGLTRAGLIVGTLQYMAPERARGQGSHHSDIFSVGAVFYELLTNQAPFTGNDPIEILENLRSQDPPPLAEVDPTLPTELGAILERALQKDPTRRLATLGQMRTQLLQVRRKLSEDAERVRRDVQSRLRQLHELREALTARLGGPWAADETVFVVEDHAPLATLERVDKDTTARIDRMQELLTRAEALRPVLDRGLAALQRGDYELAVADLDRVVAEMPEHARAAESLREAQHHVDAQNQSREQLASLMREATAAYDAGAFARCLEILRSLIESTAPAAAPPEVQTLRGRAETAMAREQAEAASRMEARRRAVEAATGMRGQAEIARQDAEAAAAPRYQQTLWNSAEAKFSAGQSALAGESYAQGERHFHEARQTYEQAAAAARHEQAAAATAALQAEMAKQAGAAKSTRADSVDETVFVDTARILSEQAVTASMAAPTAPPGTSPLTVSMPAPPAASVAAPPTGPIAPPAGPVVTPPTSRVADPIAAPTSPLSSETSGKPSAPGAERSWPAPVASPSGSSRRVSVPRTPAGSPISGLPMRYLAIAGGGLAVLLIGLVVWLSGGRGPAAPDKSLEQLIATVGTARDRATKADAPTLAANLLSKADASRSEGERLWAARDAAGSTKAYQTAAERYAEAENQAQLKREQRTEADAARAKMAAEKRRAAQDAPDFSRALELERQGGTMYGQLAFTDATTSFRTAGELFAKAVPLGTTAPAPAPPAVATPAPTTKTPPTTPVSPPATVTPAPATGPRADIRAALDSYVRAVETKDVELMRRVRPSLTDAEVQRLRQSNAIKQSHKVDLRVYEITVNGDEATADGRREDMVVLSSGQRLQTETAFSYTLKRSSRGWVIDQVRESADQPAQTRPAPPRVPRRSDATP